MLDFDVEHKDIQAPTADLFIKAADVDDMGIFRGHAAAFGNKDSWNDIIHPGAFSKAIKNFSEVKVLWYHNSKEPIGRPLQMREDKKGLWTETQLELDLEMGRKVHTLLKSGLVNRLSIGFNADPKKQKFVTEGGLQVRHLHDIELWEYSPVTFAANKRAKITSVKSARNPRELEEILRRSGLPVSLARYMAANHKFDGAGLSESDGAESQFQAGLCESDGKGKMLDELCDVLRNDRKSIFVIGDLADAPRRRKRRKPPSYQRCKKGA